MATHTLTADTLVSTLTLADGDTIELAGFNIIWDADLRSVWVTITNGGAAAHFECRNGGGVSLNASLPSNVSPWVDPDNPLPESNYEAGLTANASFIFALSTTLGGGNAVLPTGVRAGNFWAFATAYPTSTTITFDRDLPLHPGDYLIPLGRWDAMMTVSVIEYDAQTRTATVSRTPIIRTVGFAWGLVAGGVCFDISNLPNAASIFSATMQAGTLNILRPTANKGFSISKSNKFYAQRFGTAFFDNGNSTGFLIGFRGWIKIHQFVGQGCFYTNDYGPNQPKSIHIDEGAISGLIGGGVYSTALSPMFIGGGVVNNTYQTQNINPVPCATGVGLFAKNVSFSSGISTIFSNNFRSGALVAEGCSFAGTPYYDSWIEPDGTITKNFDATFLPYTWFHAPATSANTTWRYEDHTVKPHVTLHIRALWKRAENSAATASVAITDPANWYAVTQGGALAETVFGANVGADWTERVISWRNDGETDAQVRVWECVSGDTSGGYLRTIEATGGPM